MNVSGFASFQAGSFFTQAPLQDATKYLQPSSSSESSSDSDREEPRSKKQRHAPYDPAGRDRVMAVLARQHLAAVAKPSAGQHTASGVPGVNVDRSGGWAGICIVALRHSTSLSQHASAGDRQSLLYKALFATDRLVAQHKCVGTMYFLESQPWGVAAVSFGNISGPTIYYYPFTHTESWIANLLAPACFCHVQNRMCDWQVTPKTF